MAKKDTPWNIPEKVVKAKATETMQQKTTPPSPTPEPVAEKKEVAKKEVVKKMKEVKKTPRKSSVTKQQQETRVLRVDEDFHTKVKFLAIDKKMKLKAYLEDLIEKEWQKSKFKSM